MRIIEAIKKTALELIVTAGILSAASGTVRGNPGYTPCDIVSSDPTFVFVEWTSERYKELAQLKVERQKLRERIEEKRRAFYEKLGLPYPGPYVPNKPQYNKGR